MLQQCSPPSNTVDASKGGMSGGVETFATSQCCMREVVNLVDCMSLPLMQAAALWRRLMRLQTRMHSLRLDRCSCCGCRSCRQTWRCTSPASRER